jgi:excisionase family DNA binding protein
MAARDTGGETVSRRKRPRRSATRRRAPEPALSARDAGHTAEVREFYTVGQLAELLQLTEMTIYRMVNRGDLPCYEIGRVKRFRHRDVEDFLDACRVPASNPKTPRRH